MLAQRHEVRNEYFLDFFKYLIYFLTVGVTQLNAEKQPIKIKANCSA